MADLELCERNIRVAKKWLNAIFSTVAKYTILKGIVIFVLVTTLALSTQLASLYVVKKIVDKNYEHFTNVTEQREKIHNLYIVDLIDACLTSNDLDPINTERYCAKAKEYYMYKAQVSRGLKDNYINTLENNEFLVMKADINYLINEQEVENISRKYPFQNLPEVSFVFSLWFTLISCLISGCCGWLFYNYIQRYGKGVYHKT
ncbi:hypothetical protein [Photobacterium alginatilyticum]|uniref:Uncharacterized protein n=1 Tax=Photobacterium alginatilyticum TaxID=1775171 RepID=A0ABW9YRP3_9GAMM|nr:hypothetical protein [Photobacterium alginatilyticum]NBI56370.1 hypothetical protein [Photobacterium alginatilyticum]